MSSGGSAITVGYRYYFGIHMGVCRGGVDEIAEIRVGDRTAWVGSSGSTNTQINVDAYNLFGGEAGEGGVQGTAYVLQGGPDQGTTAAPIPSGLTSLYSGIVPGMRKACTVFFDGIVGMLNPYPKPWKFRVRRITQGWENGCWLPNYATIKYQSDATAGSDATLPTWNFGTAVRLYPSANVRWQFFDNPLSSDGWYTVEARFRLASQSPYGQQLLMMHRMLFTEIGDNWMCSLSADASSLVFTCHDATVAPVSVALPSPVANLTWHHVEIAMRKRQKYVPEATLYVVDFDVYFDGVSLGVVTLDPNSFAGLPIPDGVTSADFAAYEITTYMTIGGGRFDGWMDEVRLSNTHRHTSSFTIPDVPYTSDSATYLLCHFEGLSGSTNFTDASSYGRTPYDTITGAVITATFASGNSVSDPVPDFPDTDRTIHAMNPVHILYQCLTSKEWGRGLPAEALGTSFEEAARTLYAEAFGLCLKWTRTDTIESFVQQILNTIGAVMYQDRTTGLIELKLVRGDYVATDLPLFDAESGLIAVEEAAVANPTDSVNEVIVSYRDPITDTDKKVRAQNLASFQAAGGVSNSTSVSYQGVPVAALALRLAQRDLRLASVSLRRFTLTLNRRGWSIYPGQCIRIKDLTRNIPDTVVRVAKFEEGNLRDGRVKITAVQDVFRMPTQAFSQVQASTWIPPNTAPCIGESTVIEVPYFLLNRYMTPADFAAVTPEAGRWGTLLTAGQPLNNSYDVAVKSGISTTDENPPDGRYYCGYTA